MGTIFEQIVNGNVFENEADSAIERVSRLLWGKALESTVTHAVVHAEVTIDRLQAVVGLFGNEMGILTFGKTFPADDAFVSQTGTDIVERGATRNNGLGAALMRCENNGHSVVIGVEDLSKIAIGKQSSLAVRLLTETKTALEETLGCGYSIEAPLHILRGADIEQNGNQFGVEYSLTMTWRVIDTDGHPEELTMPYVLERSNVLRKDFEEHVGTELPDAWTTDAWKFLGNAV